MAHLAAQAGVRYSIDKPMEYIESNIVGFANILEGCRNHEVDHLYMPVVQAFTALIQPPHIRYTRM